MVTDPFRLGIASLVLSVSLGSSIHSQTAPEILPTPKRLELGRGELAMRSVRVLAGPEASHAATAIANHFAAWPGAESSAGATVIQLRIDEGAVFASGLNREQRPESYRLEIRPEGIEILAPEKEGLLRAAASLLQVARVGPGTIRLPCLSITDWPNTRYRCASDWLLNVEVNRWAYDWGDGPRKYVERIKRKLDLCFLYKINQVWFDGFGWSVDRSPDYAEMMRQCTRYARQRGIRLTFCGYGGGYGTSYQPSDIYRAGYFGSTFLNRESYPDGRTYACRGMGRIEKSRIYGTCLSNEGLARAKIDELKRFVSQIEPGFLYIHDTDSGSYAAASEAWRMRCDKCRGRWPGDNLESADGQAGAMADWFSKVRGELNPITTASGYRADRDLTLIFISPLYATYYEKGPPDLWRRELDYFRTLSRCLGRGGNVEFGVRELFYGPDGVKKIPQLREALDEVGNGHAPHVISFMGGDNYTSDDLFNFSGIMAPFFEGAESICLSNGGLHEEPIQVLNSEILWSGTAQGYSERPCDEAAARKLRDRMANGRYRPATVFGPGRLMERVCQRLWGDAAGSAMYRAYMAGDESGDGPVSRVWFSVMGEIGRLQKGTSERGQQMQDLRERWRRRLAATEEAAGHAREAVRLTDNEDVAWFARCLEVGRRFSLAMLLAIERRTGENANVGSLASTLDELESYLRAEFTFDRADVLGGDPGCWRETVRMLREFAGSK